MNKGIVLLFLFLSFSFSIQASNSVNSCVDKGLNIDSVRMIMKSEPENTYLKGKKGSRLNVKNKFYKQLHKECFQTATISELLQTLSHDEFQYITSILYKVAFYTKDISAVDNYKHLVSYKVGKGYWADVNIKRLFGLYMSARAFDLAKKLKIEYPNVSLPSLPEVKELGNGDKRNMYVLAGDKPELVEAAADIPKKGGHIVVVSNTMCGFSQRFVSWLSKQDSFNSVFAESSTWISPQSIGLYLDETQQRNALYPELPLNYVKNEQDWPEISYWGTPAFYFYLDGKLVSSMFGWPEEGRIEQLTERLQGIKLVSKPI